LCFGRFWCLGGVSAAAFTASASLATRSHPRRSAATPAGLASQPPCGYGKIHRLRRLVFGKTVPLNRLYRLDRGGETVPLHRVARGSLHSRLALASAFTASAALAARSRVEGVSAVAFTASATLAARSHPRRSAATPAGLASQPPCSYGKIHRLRRLVFGKTVPLHRLRRVAFLGKLPVAVTPLYGMMG